MKNIIELERIRKKTIGKFQTLKFIFIGVIFFVMIYAIMKFSADIFKFFTKENTTVFGFEDILFYMICVILVAWIYDSSFSFLKKAESHEFVRKYKELYMKPYFDSLGLKYNRTGHVHALDLIKSGLFVEFDKQSGNDQVLGNINGVSFVFSDIVLENIYHKDHFLDNYRHKRRELIFQGIFFVADFHKQINSKTFVMQKGSPKQGKFQALHMDNIKFNQIFNTYTTDVQNAMYILTPAFMEKILNLYFIMRAPISISFVESRVYIAIERGFDSFEPNINKNIVTKNLAFEIKKDINAILDIIKILNLNNKIWISAKYNPNLEKSNKFTF